MKRTLGSVVDTCGGWVVIKILFRYNKIFVQDIVILLDTSGSMTGLRKEIAKHVVINIMETLGEDDFVTVLTFSDETRPLVECFTDSDGEPELVQATTDNIAEFTEAVNNIETTEIANFTSALTEAFTLLERYRTKKVKLLFSALRCLKS